jgi:hypothetical protein
VNLEDNVHATRYEPLRELAQYYILNTFGSWRLSFIYSLYVKKEPLRVLWWSYWHDALWIPKSIGRNVIAMIPFRQGSTEAATGYFFTLLPHNFQNIIAYAVIEGHLCIHLT